MINTSDLILGNEILISPEKWDYLNANFTQPEIIDAISDAIAELPFPFKRIALSQAREDFDALVRLDSEKLLKTGKIKTKYEYRYDIGDSYIDISDIGGVSSNYFHQENRFACDSLNSPSPVRVWTTEKFRKNMLKNLWTMETKKVDSNRLRSAMSLRNYTASQFRPSAAKTIYEHFEARRVIDFSCGWGDRLSGFLACSATETYFGCDPNLALHESYKAQVAEFNRTKSVHIDPVPAEDWKLEGEFDLAFTSPPYFDIERYSQDAGQSWKRYKRLEDWLEGFLYKAIANVWKHIRQGGHLAVNIADVYGHHRLNHICDPMNDFIATLDRATYKGGIGYRMAKRPNSKSFIKEIYVEPVFVWQKH